ncbi:triose-phosphate isomerase [bacterium (Candidatus Blackallbacteria) CG17_big_fil_post_rev_8_21_14_2_50_48_46]|uniref:Triosephosphate isomerase n=1 Tax=bacterium (Candidatus Blackallbacteria) CG17_big_fil_post_rev_8_21_14_2_50_48_46 TaxID=2014261 RepID=A0A2M7FZZ4_9BACT|nr:MAG: triose-phosphate isomerase [bacterium (Candidatus Blackallbacteria) CG18_big_fil_WC_8_21_14_2_50_49_26]PIW14909.1 MAG: triose-phosphate isomerase [bacterium (Candidatus Blackallbacteria) CG17_big_fil_post_rev_8_21_14_2_50_48_46]PIW44303.1 MAG: triose-phosphate isomerase [bacterium (Candidatus Blackallbacteria) CG13_big_fil_rev_8_21_14_2_50_49_14]
MSRKPMMAGNWKMNKTSSEALAFAEALSSETRQEDAVEMVICAPFTALTSLHQALKGTRVQLGAQNMYFEESGAYTGEISPQMILAEGCSHVVIGHSERREYFQENDVIVNRKVALALKSGLNPILCCGESLTEREAGGFEDKILSQVELGLQGVQMIPSYTDRVVIAYEPIWAIGTGKTCDDAEANRILGLIRAHLARLYNQDTAAKIRLLYGGSVKPSTIEAQIQQPHIDGALVGGASLDPASFAELVRLTRQFGI